MANVANGVCRGEISGVRAIVRSEVAKSDEPSSPISWGIGFPYRVGLEIEELPHEICHPDRQQCHAGEPCGESFKKAEQLRMLELLRLSVSLNAYRLAPITFAIRSNAQSSSSRVTTSGGPMRMT